MNKRSCVRCLHCIPLEYGCDMLRGKYYRGAPGDYEREGTTCTLVGCCETSIAMREFRVRILLEVEAHGCSEEETSTLYAIMASGLIDGLSLEALVQQRGMCMSEFVDSFIAACGVSPMRWFIRQRLRIAHRLLGLLPISISALAALCGFTSVSHFISEYRRRYGSMPLRRSANLAMDVCTPTIIIIPIDEI